MRKALALLLALVVVSSLGAVQLVHGLAEPADKVVFTETTLYGSISAAEGLEVSKHVQLGNHIIWDSNLDFFNAGFTTHTNCVYSNDAWNDPQYNDHWSQDFQGVFLYSSLTNSYESTGSGLASMFTVMRPVEQAQDKLIAQTPDGQEQEMTLRMADYYDYYPIEVNIQLPNLFYGYPEGIEVDKYESPEIYAIQTINEFFRIPILPEQKYTIGVEKAPDGSIVRSWGESVEDADYFSIVSTSVATDDACYFYFSNRTNQGKLVDTSQIPGGYGIYILPYGYVAQENYLYYDYYEGYDVFADDLRLFYPIDPETEILNLSLSDNQKTLLLHTREKGKYLVTVISAETGKALQQFDLGAFPEDVYSESITADAADVVLIGHSLSVLRPVSETEWELLYQTTPTEIELDSSFSPLNTWYGRKMAFDGERLAIISILNWEGNWQGCGFALAVYNKEGLQYYGQFESSLSKANSGIDLDQNWNFERVTDLHEPNGLHWTA